MGKSMEKNLINGEVNMENMRRLSKEMGKTQMWLFSWNIVQLSATGASSSGNLRGPKNETRQLYQKIRTACQMLIKPNGKISR